MSQADYKFCESYLKILQGQFSGLNLTRSQNAALFHVEQFQDSIAPLEHSKRFRASLEEKKLLLDVGFGGGIPILPLAYRCPWAAFTGLEARGKKVRAVGEIAQQLGLKNTSFYHYRIEEIEVDLPCLITFKAVGGIEECLSKLCLSALCKIYFYKGPKLQEKEGPSWAQGSNWRAIEDIFFKIGDLSRRILAFENTNVPHGTTGKNLVKLSSLL